jgi:predicted NAD/FAD-binding protein
MWSFPARFLAEFFDNHGMLSMLGRPRWRTIRGGSAHYVETTIGQFRGRLRVGLKLAGAASTPTPSRHGDRSRG